MRAVAITTVVLIGGISSMVAAQAMGSRPTREFLQAATESDGFEMAEAYSALAESKDAQVRAFAQRMIRDHGETSRQLADAAQRAGLKAPTPAVGAGQSPFLAALQSLRGSDFDRAYWQQQALAHRAALVTAQNYAATGDAPDVRRAAASIVPIIQTHLRMAEAKVAQTAAS